MEIKEECFVFQNNINNIVKICIGKNEEKWKEATKAPKIVKKLHLELEIGTKRLGHVLNKAEREKVMRQAA